MDNFANANHKKTPSEFHQNYNAADCIQNPEKACLITDISNLLSGGIVKIEITPQAWCSLMKFAVEEYVSAIQMWLIENQWSSLNGKSLTENDICFALTQRSFDYERQFAQAYSKQVGHQTNGPYELKKDYFVIEEGKMVYEVPAGREINAVMWLTPSDITHATFSSLGYGTMIGGVGISGGIGWGGSGYNIMNGAYYIAPAYDIVLRAADYGLKNRILKSDLTYKVTAGPNGTRLVHLYSTPNAGNKIGIRKELYGLKVWYHYYDTIDMDAEAKNKCLEECADIIKYPSDVPMTMTDFCDLNNPSKIWVRKFLTALAKEAIGRARGKFSGKIPVPDAEGQLDYESFLAEGKEEKDALRTELKEWLDKMSSDKVLERKANESDNLNRILGKNPNGIFVI
jgi:hypothetical protein